MFKPAAAVPLPPAIASKASGPAGRRNKISSPFYKRDDRHRPKIDVHFFLKSKSGPAGIDSFSSRESVRFDLLFILRKLSRGDKR